MTTALLALTRALADARRITADDVVALRGVVFGVDYLVSPEEADALIDLDDATADHAPEWRDFYLEALTDFLVRQQRPSGYVDEPGAAWLMAALERDGQVSGENELALLVHILDQADQVPAGLVQFALEQVKARVIKDGVVEADEANLVRRALYAPGGDSNIAITRAEAEILFDINDACRGGDNDPAWTDLFSKALIASVMTVSGYQGLSRQEALRRQIWLETPGPMGDFVGRMFSGLKEAWRDPAEAMRDDRDDLFIADNLADETAYRLAEPLDATEAVWLAERMKRDGLFDEGEQRVVDFLRREAPVIHPVFQPVLEEASSEPGAARPFGRRGAA